MICLSAPLLYNIFILYSAMYIFGNVLTFCVFSAFKVLEINHKNLPPYLQLNVTTATVFQQTA